MTHDPQSSKPCSSSARGVTRRDFVRMAGAVGAGLAFPAIANSRTLTLSLWGGTTIDGLKSIVVPEFKRLTGADIAFDIGPQGARYNKILAQRNRPSVDVFFGTDEAVAAGLRQGVLAPCERSRVSRYDEIDPRLLSLRQLDTPAAIAGAPYTVLSYALAYTPSAVKAPPVSWLDLWTPEYAGKIAYFSAAHSIMPANILLMAELLGGGESNVEPAFAKLKTLKPAKLTNFWTDWAPLQKTGDVILATENDAYIAAMQAQGYPVEFAVPKEGSLAALNYLSLVKGSKNAELAHAFIDLMIDARIQEQIASVNFTGVTNKNVKVSNDVAAKITVGAKIDKLRLADPLVALARRAAWTERINTEVIPAWSVR